MEDARVGGRCFYRPPLPHQPYLNIFFRTNSMRASTLVGSGEEDKYGNKYFGGQQAFWAIASGFYMPLK